MQVGRWRRMEWRMLAALVAAAFLFASPPSHAVEMSCPEEYHQSAHIHCSADPGSTFKHHSDDRGCCMAVCTVYLAVAGQFQASIGIPDEGPEVADLFRSIFGHEPSPALEPPRTQAG